MTMLHFDRSRTKMPTKTKERQECPTPWRVLNATLRPKPFDVRIIEIRDANDKAVIPWGGFDSAKGSHASKLRIARRICRAVNATKQTNI